MPYVGYGQVATRDMPPMLASIVNGSYWPTWPTSWRTGLAASIRPPAPGAWTPPERLGAVLNNLASMVKRMEQMGRDLRPADLQALGVRVAVDYRTKPPTVTYSRVA